MNNNFEIDRYNQHNLPEGARSSVCPLCSSSRKKKKEKCMSLDWTRGLGTCHHCREIIQLHTYKKIEKGYTKCYVSKSINHDKNRFEFLPSQYIPTNKWIEKTNLYKFLSSQFGEQNVQSVFNIYNIGASKHWIFEGGYSNVFPQIDSNGNLRQLKIIAYNPETGKRLHQEDNAILWKGYEYVQDTLQQKVWFAGKSLLDNPEAKLKQCFFGEHLLANSTLPIAIVESEKTALIATIAYPQYIWIATGGKFGCSWTSKEVFQVLKNREVILFPDTDCYTEWKNKAIILSNFGINTKINSMVIAYSQQNQFGSHWDIADYILHHKFSF